MKKKLNITSLGETPIKKGVKTRIDISELSTQFAPTIFYNQRLLNQFKKLLKDKGIPYTFHKSNFYIIGHVLVVEQFSLVLWADGEGRFNAYNKGNSVINYKVSFQANSTIQLIYKLLRFKIIGYQTASQLVKDKPKAKPIKTTVKPLVNFEEMKAYILATDPRFKRSPQLIMEM